MIDRIKEFWKEFWGKIAGTVAEQEWFQQLRSKWEELDPQSQSNLQIGGISLMAVALASFLGSLMWSVHGLKKELNDKQSLLSLLESSNDEMRILHESNSAHADSGDDNWAKYFETTAGTQGIGKDAITVGTPKPVSDASPQASKGDIKESWIDVSLKHVNIKQVVRLAFALENGTHPVKLRNLSIDTKNDPSGYLDATLSLSAFSVAQK